MAQVILNNSTKTEVQRDPKSCSTDNNFDSNSSNSNGEGGGGAGVGINCSLFSQTLDSRESEKSQKNRFKVNYVTFDFFVLEIVPEHL